MFSLLLLLLLSPRTGLALFLFTSLEALPIFMEERSIYTREHSRGAYRVLSYSLTNFLIYLPVCLTLSVVFTSISYFMVRRVLCVFPPRCYLPTRFTLFVSLRGGWAAVMNVLVHFFFHVLCHTCVDACSCCTL